VDALLFFKGELDMLSLDFYTSGESLDVMWSSRFVAGLTIWH
jgi:hypothetical protein